MNGALFSPMNEGLKCGISMQYLRNFAHLRFNLRIARNVTQQIHTLHHVGANS